MSSGIRRRISFRKPITSITITSSSPSAVKPKALKRPLRGLSKAERAMSNPLRRRGKRGFYFGNLGIFKPQWKALTSLENKGLVRFSDKGYKAYIIKD